MPDKSTFYDNDLLQIFDAAKAAASARDEKREMRACSVVYHTAERADGQVRFRRRARAARVARAVRTTRAVDLGTPPLRPAQALTGAHCVQHRNAWALRVIAVAWPKLALEPSPTEAANPLTHAPRALPLPKPTS